MCLALTDTYCFPPINLLRLHMNISAIFKGRTQFQLMKRLGLPVLEAVNFCSEVPLCVIELLLYDRRDIWIKPYSLKKYILT